MTKEGPKHEETSKPQDQPDSPEDQDNLVLDVLCGLNAEGKYALARTWCDETDGHLILAPFREPPISLDNVPTLKLPGCPCCVAHDLLFEAIAAHRATGNRRVLLVTDALADLPRLVRLIAHRAKQGFPVELGHLATYFSADSLAALLQRSDPAEGAQHGGGSGSVAEARLRQLELADVIVFDRAPDTARQTIARLNPGGTVVQRSQGLSFLETKRNNDERLPGWLQHLVGIGENEDPRLLLFRARRPFHPVRLQEYLKEPTSGILRGHGFIWLATDMERVANWSRAGLFQTVKPGGKWWATRLPIYWPEPGTLTRERLDDRWDETWGDRRQEVVALGEPNAIRALEEGLQSCLLTEAEMSQGEAAWRSWAEGLPADGWSFHTDPIVAD